MRGGYYGPSLLLASRLIFGCALIVLFAIDLEHHLLPNVITLPGIVVGFAFSFFTEPGWLSSLIGILVGGGMLYAIGGSLLPRSRHEEGLGMGDVKMLAMIGRVSRLEADVRDADDGVVRRLDHRRRADHLAARRHEDALPFGTFLAMGAALAATVGIAAARLVPAACW